LEVDVQARTTQATRQVEVQLGDIVSAPLSDLQRRMTGELRLRGRIVETVVLGDPAEPFALMEVDGIETPMLVPISALQR